MIESMLGLGRSPREGERMGDVLFLSRSISLRVCFSFVSLGPSVSLSYLSLPLCPRPSLSLVSCIFDPLSRRGCRRQTPGLGRIELRI